MQTVSKSPGTFAGRSLRSWLQSLGPGLITAALVFGPSKMTITSKLGSLYGFSLLWLVVLAIFFMFVFTSMAARIGIATHQSLLSTIRQKWGKNAAIGVGIGVFLVCTSFQAGNSAGVGIAVAELTNTPVVVWIVILNLVGISLLFFRTFYNVLEKIMISLIIVKLFAFVTTLIMIKPDAGAVAKGAFIPSAPAGSSGLIIAFFASSVSIVGACYQSYLVQERRRISPGIIQTGSDSFTGIVLLGVMSAMVMICAGAVLHPQGIMVNTATDMSRALEPIFGSYAASLFLTGLFGAAFSALIGNATLGGTLLSDSLGKGSNLNSKTVKMLIALVMVAGAVIAIIFGKLPLQLIVFAQSITIFIVPFIGIAMFAIANDKKIMGSQKNSLFMKVAGATGLVIVILLALINLKDFIVK
ncbi:MAG: Nramp family divalent metal transporter [Chitinophagaceae bacterium]|nr:Nramp family divalent metal transporter [Chitinophagaceae bacterium]